MAEQEADWWVVVEDSIIQQVGRRGKPGAAADVDADADADADVDADADMNADAGVVADADVGCGGVPEGEVMVDGEGGLLMPGVIDCHVHFREPGLTHKADMASESRAALAGGVTSFLDMPNTKPATTSIEAWEQKMEIASEKSLINYGFFIGATNDNLETLKAADYTRIPGVKLFMGSSTGNMLVDDNQTIEQIFSQVPAIVAVHAEDQGIIDANTQAAKAEYPDGVPVDQHSKIRSVDACYASTARAVELARKYKHRLHICHLTTARELSLLDDGDDQLITSEVSPHHLLWCDEDYAAQGSRIKMNPAVKSSTDREALRQAVRDWKIDIIATDHAPHQWEEKQGNALTAASGAPMIQFSLPAMLTLFDDLTVLRTMSLNPSIIYSIDRRGLIHPGYFADLVLVREVEPYTVTDADVISKCAWTPMSGRQLRYRVEKTWVNGHLAYDNGKFDDTSHAMALKTLSTKH